MHVREDLVFDKHSGKLVGFVDLGDVNNHMLKFEKSLQSEHENVHPLPLAKSILVFLVRGLFTPLQFPYAQFPSSSLSSDLIFAPFWEAVKRLEMCGLKVVAVTADGAKPNRAFYNLHDLHGDSYKVINPYSEEKRYIYFFSDLLKTVRNCFASSKRCLWCNGKHILWSHVVNLYLKGSTDGLCLVPKLKYEHVYLSSFSKMRVDLAAQVLSNSVSKALALSDDGSLTETARFIEIMDKFFDCMNVRTISEGTRKRNPFLDPYRPGDFRLKWLESTFLKYLSDWEKSVQDRDGFTNEQKEKMLLSRETRHGLKFTVRSLIDLINYLFTLPGVSFFLSERLNQDPLEKFFGMQRQRGGVHDNPNVQEFEKNTQALRVVNSICGSVRGNCRGSFSKDERVINEENGPLNKRKCTRKTKSL